jgi:hypothetical protein
MEKGPANPWKPVAAVMAVIGTLGVATLLGAFLSDGEKHHH